MGRFRRRCWLELSTVLIFCSLSFLLHTGSATARPRAALASSNQASNSTSSNTPTRECSTVQIRNSFERMEQLLRGCAVIEGDLIIAFIQNASDLNSPVLLNASFPELREVTGHVVIFRMNVRSLANVFPNLAVIRGQTNVDGYSLIVLENNFLQDVALPSLTNILSGSVRIEKNPRMSYAASIDWNDIVFDTRKKILIRDNLDIVDSCQNCPRNKCWGPGVCQKFCPSECVGNKRTCTARSNSTGAACCEEQCLGGCSVHDSTESCHVCRYFRSGKHCVDKCPENTYALFDRRCVSEEECLNYMNKEWKAFNKVCRSDCPVGYFENALNKSQCLEGRVGQLIACPRAKSKFNAIADLKPYADCEHYDGSLIIDDLVGEGVSSALYKAFSKLKVVTGFVKIARIPAITSLNFLENLERIENGTVQGLSLMVFNNINLQELWPQPKLLYVAEGIHFHHNEKLCLEKIDSWAKVAGKANYTPEFVSPTTNGDRIACNVIKIALGSKNTGIDSVGLFWENKVGHFKDHRSLAMFTVYYMKTEVNVTQFEGRDACDSNQWMAQDIEVDPRTFFDGKPFHTVLEDLQPATRYAVYVTTEVLTGVKENMHSDMLYITTLEGVPSKVRDVVVRPEGPNDVKLTWEPPNYPNGALLKYVIVVNMETDADLLREQGTFCSDGHSRLELQKTPESVTNITEKPSDCSQCTCKIDSDDRRSAMRNQRTSDISFEDSLHDSLFKKRDPTNLPSTLNRSRREISQEVQTTPATSKAHFSIDKDGLDAYCGEADDVTDSKSPRRRVCEGVSANVTELRITQLNHFTQYQFSVYACLLKSSQSGCVERSFNRTHKLCCSKSTFVFKRTPKLDRADAIDSSSVHLYNILNDTATLGESDNNVRLAWHAPRSPNSFIIGYSIEYKRDLENANAVKICVSIAQFNASGGLFLNIPNPGNYSFRVQATSLAGDGGWSDSKSFFVKGKQQPSIYNTLTFAVAIIFIIVFFACTYLSYCYYRKKGNDGIPDKVLYASVNPEYMSHLYEPDEWEVPRDKVKLLNDIGTGYFGTVYKGIVYDVNGHREQQCAVKTVKEGAGMLQRNSFLKEATMMKQLNTAHVVRLIGVVSKGEPLYVIMELMENGDLKTYLRAHRPDEMVEGTKCRPLSPEEVLQMAAEIADGMAYLASLKYVHRDLAARNCMVAHDLTVKIGDFGMTRDVYENDYYRKDGRGVMPVRWMSPESLRDGVFTTYGDVWSYGIVLWEIVSLGAMPYPGFDPEMMIKSVLARNVMERPDNCPDILYRIMRQCWQYQPKTRPTFDQIVEELLPETNEKFRSIAFYTNRAAHSNDSDDQGGLSAENTPLVPSSSNRRCNLSSLVEMVEDHHQEDDDELPHHHDKHPAGDCDEESNLYISDDVISDGDGDDSVEDKWSPNEHRMDGSLPKSDYGSGRSPPMPLLDQPIPTMTPDDNCQSPTPMVKIQKHDAHSSPESQTKDKITSNGSIQPNDRVFFTMNNRTTTC